VGSDSLPARDLTAEEALEIESDHRRRVLAAFVLGAEARLDRPSLRPWRGFLSGIGLALAILLVVGVVGVARATVDAGAAPKATPAQAAPSPRVSP
jgi:hypothetical protein